MSSDAPPASPIDDPVIEWYRRDLSKSLARVLIPAALLVVVGSVAVGLGVSRLSATDPALALRARPTFVSEAPAPHGTPFDYAIFFGGLAFVVLGTGSTVFGLRRVMRNEEYLLLRASGLFEHGDRGDRAIPWDAIESVRYDAGLVRIALRDGSDVALTVPYAGIAPEALARRLAEAHRKGIWGFLGKR